MYSKKMIKFDQILYTTKINKKTIGKSIGSDHFCYQKMLQKKHVTLKNIVFVFSIKTIKLNINKKCMFFIDQDQ